MRRKHDMPFGAQCVEGVVRFRLWAPKAHSVEVCLPQEGIPLTRQAAGWFEVVTPRAHPGSKYQFRIDGGQKVPDPASRYQHADVHGPSEVVNPAEFEWQDEHWQGRPWKEAIIYELHVGTFSPEGTFAGVAQRLDYLKELGVTAIELMPVADFPGTRDWGYDGVLPYAPDHTYGRPEALKRLVQAAHARDLMIFLDVVYNHFGPEGNYLYLYAPQFFTDRHHTPWGDAIDFDGPNSRVVRDFFIHNALYWLEEYHFDGLRFDAVHAIADESRPDILTELAEAVRSHFGSIRQIHLVLENDDNAAHYLKRDERGSVHYYNAQWNDDIHHALHVLITGERDGYYADYAESPICHLGRCLVEGFSYQGQRSPYRGDQPRGEPSKNLPLTCFVSFLQNHDQVGNRAFGERILNLASVEAVQAAIAVLMLAPSPPLLFMGEEFGAETPFLFFSDFGRDLRDAVSQGRRNEFARFQKFASAESRAKIPDPACEQSFLSSKLDWASLQEMKHQNWLTFYRDLIRVRREWISPWLSERRKPAEYKLLGTHAIRVDWQLENETTLTLLANLGREPVKREMQPRGRTIYQLRAEEVRLAPWSAAWLVHP